MPLVGWWDPGEPASRGCQPDTPLTRGWRSCGVPCPPPSYGHLCHADYGVSGEFGTWPGWSLSAASIPSQSCGEWSCALCHLKNGPVSGCEVKPESVEGRPG